MATSGTESNQFIGIPNQSSSFIMAVRNISLIDRMFEEFTYQSMVHIDRPPQLMTSILEEDIQEYLDFAPLQWHPVGSLKTRRMGHQRDLSNALKLTDIQLLRHCCQLAAIMICFDDLR